MTMFEKTTDAEVTAELNVYAIPRTENEIKNSDDGCPFGYKVYAGYNSPYQSGAIKLHTIEHIVHLPGGIPLLEKAVETLKEAMEEERRESAKKLADMQARIDALALIEYIPEVQPEPEIDDSMDGDHDSAMASAGHGTDEDYGGTDERL